MYLRYKTHNDVRMSLYPVKPPAKHSDVTSLNHSTEPLDDSKLTISNMNGINLCREPNLYKVRLIDYDNTVKLN